MYLSFFSITILISSSPLIEGICTDRIPAFYDTVLDVRVIADVYVIQNNGILDVTVVSDKGFLKITESSTVPLTIQPLEIRLFSTFAPTLYFCRR